MRQGIFVLAVCLASVVSAACSGPRCRQRGWVGGDFERVRACGGWLEPEAPACAPGKVIGMPAQVGARSGLLLLRAGPTSPLTRAGLREGDLVVAVDGRPVEDPMAFRRGVEARHPGTAVTLDAWRDGAMLRARVTVGRETYEKVTTVGMYLGASPHADLWPFDDGIDVLGLVVAKSSSRRNDLDGPRREYLAKAMPAKNVGPVRQEDVNVRVLPLLVGTHKLIRAQEPVAAIASR
jgi:hypothetical protein